jgi:two-component system cell cycle sensor histidine kinase/response regulator CckA
MGKPQPGARPRAPLLRELSGPLLTVAVAVFVAVFSELVARIPNPPAILLIFVVFSAFRGGVRSGLASASVAWVYFAIAFSKPDRLFEYQPEDLKRIALWLLSLPTLALMVGRLKERSLAAERSIGKQAEERFTTVLHASPVGMVLTRLSDGRILDANRAALEMFGYERHEMVGSSARELQTWRDAPKRELLITRLEAEGRVPNFDIVGRTKSGETVEVLGSLELVEVDSQRCMLSFLVDMTERKRREEELRRKEEELRSSQNLEAIGRLAGGIAHDFNNLLTVIGGNASFLQETMKAPEQREVVDEISAAATRAAALTRQLLDFSRKQPTEPLPLDLATSVSALTPILARTLGEKVSLVVTVEEAPSVVLANAGQIDQVIMNLVLNARDALADGGKLSIATQNVTLDEVEAALVSPRATAGNWVMLSVRDTGEGMDAATIEHIFEPFFSTKGVGRGTGLGLATVYAIVSRAGGFILVESELGQGTVFKVYLPRVEESAASDCQQPRVARAQGEVVLLVEDDPAVRTLTARLVRDLGYTALLADGSEQALDIVKRRQSPIDLILTDVVMPGMNGRELVDELCSELPDARVLFVSGYADDATLVERVRRRESAFLAKPFTRSELGAKLRELLDEPRNTSGKPSTAVGAKSSDA